MTSLEEQLKQQNKALEAVERRRKLFEAGLTEADILMDKLQIQSIALNEAIDYVDRIIRNSLDIEQNDDLDKRISAINRAEKLLESLEDFTSDILTKGLNDIKQLLIDLNIQMDAENAKNDEMRELENETLNNINDYIRKYS